MRRTVSLGLVLCFLLPGIAMAGQGGFICITEEDSARILAVPESAYNTLAGTRGTVLRESYS